MSEGAVVAFLQRITLAFLLRVYSLSVTEQRGRTGFDGDGKPKLQVEAPLAS